MTNTTNANVNANTANTTAANNVHPAVQAMVGEHNSNLKQALELYFTKNSTSEAEARKAIADVNAARGVNLQFEDFNVFKSAPVSTAEVKPETDWFSGSNLFMAGALLGTAADQVINGINVTGMVTGAAIVGGGFLMREKINELAEDSMIKRGAAAAVGAGAAVGAAYAGRAVMGMFTSEEEGEPMEQQPMPAPESNAFFMGLIK